MGGSLSIAGRVTKISDCLSSVAMYQMSMRLMHKTNIENLEKHTRSFFCTIVPTRESIVLLNESGFANLKAKVGWD
jgi:hypothetical protein